MTTYRVRLTYQFPAWNERNGLVYLVDASSKSDAIAKARRIATRDGHAGPDVKQGRQTFRVIS